MYKIEKIPPASPPSILNENIFYDYKYEKPLEVKTMQNLDLNISDLVSDAGGNKIILILVGLLVVINIIKK